MKNTFIFIITLLLIYLALIYGYRFYGKGHNYEYTINNDDKELIVNETFNNDKNNPNYYITIMYDDIKFGFQTFDNFNNKSKIIKNIYTYSNDKYVCVLPSAINNKVISDILCLNKDNKYFYYYNSLKGMDKELDIFVDNLSKVYNIDNWIDNSDKYDNSGITVYNDNIKNNQYIMITNYKGLFLINNKKVNNITLFTNDVYQKKLDFVYNNKYVVADYTKKYRFHEFYVIDIQNGNKDKIISNNEISFDSYIQGQIDNKIYMFDKTSKKQFEFNMNDNTIKEIGNESIGIKIYNNETQKWENIPAMKACNEEILFILENNVSKDGFVKIDKLGTEQYGYNFYYKKVDDKYLVYRSNVQDMYSLTYVFTTSNIDNVVYFYDSVYFIDDDYIKNYSDKSGIKKIVSYKELKFNDNLYFFIYKRR